MTGIYRMPEGKRAWAAPLPETAPRYDAVVVGGGTAGAISALVLAERGCKTLIVERLNCLGGTSTAGQIDGYYFGNRGGLYEQLDAQAKAYEPLGYPQSNPNSFNAELKKRVLENRFWQAGGQIAYEADITGVLMAENRVVGVEYAQDDGLHAAYAQVVVDASAEGYVCLLAGTDYTLGRALDQKVQPFGNVRMDYHGERRVNGHDYTDCGYVNPLDPEQYSQAVLSAAKFACYLREDFRQAPRFIGMTQLVGMREGPLVEGEARVRLQDVADGKNPRNQALFTAYSNADNHGKDMAFENRPQQDWMIGCSLWGLNFTVNVPLGAVIPRGIEGLLMAGRMISVDHDLASCIRMERDIQKCGEAVGLLAAEAVARHADPRQVPYDALEKALLRSGCLLPQNDFGFIDSRKAPGEGRVRFPETLDEIQAGLASDAPGMAQWQARKLEDKVPLYAWLSEGGNLAVHTAMALALADDAAGAPLLLDCVKRRDSFIPHTSRKYNMIRGAAALYLLGRLAWKDALSETLAVIRGWNVIVPAHFTPDEFLFDAEEYRFQYLSQAIMAALEIAQRWPETRAAVDQAIDETVMPQDFSIHSTLKGKMQLKYEMAPMIRHAVACMREKRQ
mgnify:FL=1